MKSRPIIIDVITVVFITLLFLGFGKLLTATAYSISDGKDPEQLKLDILKDLESGKEMVRDIKIFAVLLFGGSLLVLFVTLLLFSFSRNLMWNKTPDYRMFTGWNWVTLIMTLLLVPLFLVYLPFHFLAALFKNYVVSQAVISIFFLFYLMLAFFVYRAYAKEKNVWVSLGKGFSKLKQVKVWKAYGISLIIFVILSLILAFIRKSLFYYPKFLIYLNLALLIGFIGWMRSYMIKK